MLVNSGRRQRVEYKRMIRVHLRPSVALISRRAAAIRDRVEDCPERPERCCTAEIRRWADLPEPGTDKRAKSHNQIAD
jgi:hypothetical protein